MRKALVVLVCAILTILPAAWPPRIAEAAVGIGWVNISENLMAVAPATSNLLDLSFINDKVGWIARGDAEEIYATTDGGATFTKILAPDGIGGGIGGGVNAICMTSETEGWTAGQDGWIYYTGDGGAHWTSIRAGSGPIRDITVPTGSKTGYSAGMYGASYRFTSTAASVLPTGISAELKSISFVSAAEGWLSGGAIIRHFTGGKWTADQTYASSDGFNSICMTPPTQGCAVGDNGVIATTADGKNWTGRVSPDTAGNTLNKVFFLNAREGWAVGDHGIILRTADSGENWEIQGKGMVDHPLTTVQFTSSTNGYAAGNDGALLKFTTLAGIEPTSTGIQSTSTPESSTQTASSTDPAIPLAGDRTALWSYLLAGAFLLILLLIVLVVILKETQKRRKP